MVIQNGRREDYRREVDILMDTDKVPLKKNEEGFPKHLEQFDEFLINNIIPLTLLACRPDEEPKTPKKFETTVFEMALRILRVVDDTGSLSAKQIEELLGKCEEISKDTFRRYSKFFTTDVRGYADYQKFTVQDKFNLVTSVLTAKFVSLNVLLSFIIYFVGTGELKHTDILNRVENVTVDEETGNLNLIMADERKELDERAKWVRLKRLRQKILTVKTKI